MKQMREAGSQDEASRLERKLSDIERDRRRELRAANSVRWNGVVEWPGIRGDDKRQRYIIEASRQSFGIFERQDDKYPEESTISDAVNKSGHKSRD